MTPEKRKFNKRVKANKRRKNHSGQKHVFSIPQEVYIEPKVTLLGRFKRFSWEIRRKFDHLFDRRLVK